MRARFHGNEGQVCAADSASITFIITEWRIAFGAPVRHVPAVGRGLSFRGRSLETAVIKDRLSTTCQVPECGKEFSFDGGETQVFEVPRFVVRASPLLPIRTAVDPTSLLHSRPNWRPGYCRRFTSNESAKSTS